MCPYTPRVQVVLNDATATWVVGYKSTFAFNLNFGGAAQTVDICGHRYVYYKASPLNTCSVRP